MAAKSIDPGASRNRSNLSAMRRNASGSLAESRIGTRRPSCAVARAGLFSTHSSTMICALVPPAPNDDTPAMRVPVDALGRHSVKLRCNVKGVPASFRFGFNSSACCVGAMVRCRICNRTFVNPAMPAAASAWPMFDFTDPIAHCPPRPNACVKPASSIGSPSSVPVPCASTYVTASADTPARSSASRMTSRCAVGFGTV